MIIHVLKAEASTCDKCIEFEKVHLQRKSRNLVHPYAQLQAQRNAPQATVRLQIGEHVMSAAPSPRLILSSSSRLNVFASRVVSIAARLTFSTMATIAHVRPGVSSQVKSGLCPMCIGHPSSPHRNCSVLHEWTLIMH